MAHFFVSLEAREQVMCWLARDQSVSWSQKIRQLVVIVQRSNERCLVMVAGPVTRQRKPIEWPVDKRAGHDSDSIPNPTSPTGFVRI